MMENDLISVLIPMYNVEKYVARCLRSVLKQTYQNLQIVVLDDGSRDRTYQIAKKFADQDPRIELLHKENENNISLTRNYLLDHVKGRYIIWVDSDDCVKPTYVEKLYRTLIDYDADVSVCGFAIQKIHLPMPKPLKSRVRVYEGDQIPAHFLFGKSLGCPLWNKMFKVDLCRDQRFNVKARYGEDLLYLIDYCKKCHRMARLNEKLYYYSLRWGSEIHKRFSDKHIEFAELMIEQCRTEQDPVLLDNIRAWTSLTCCGFAFHANRRRQPLIKLKMRYYTNLYRDQLYHNPQVKLFFKIIMWLGVRLWSRPLSKKQLSQIAS